MEPITLRQAERRGLSERDLQRLVAAGDWVKLRRNWYLPRPTTDAQDLSLKLLDTYLADYAGRAVAGHVSAALRHGLALYREDLSTTHLCRLEDGRSRRAPGLHLHAAARSLPPVGGIEHVATTVLQLASVDLEAGLVAADDALHRALVTHGELQDASAAFRFVNGAHRVRQLLLAADGRRESPGETLLAARLREAAIDVQPQFAVPGTEKWTWSGQGYSTDFQVRGSRVVIEFDGRTKYRTREDLWKEKLREDRIRSLGWKPVRITWAELFDGRAVAKVLARLSSAVA